MGPRPLNHRPIDPNSTPSSKQQIQTSISGSVKKRYFLRHARYPAKTTTLSPFLKQLVQKDIYKEVIFGPKCWSCFEGLVMWTCPQCNRHYHRKCALENPDLPKPKFNVSFVEAVNADYKHRHKVQMILCSLCIQEKVPFVLEIGNEPIILINPTLMAICRKVELEFDGPHREKISCTDVLRISRIVKKVGARKIKNFDGLYAEFRWLLYESIMLRGVDSEEADMAKHILWKLSTEIYSAEHCVECYSRRLQLNGTPVTNAYSNEMSVATCQVPHVVLWVKHNHPAYRPAKLLAYDPVQGAYFLQFFGEIPESKITEMEEANSRFYVYSEKYPGTIHWEKRLGARLRECRLYMENVKSRFGKVIIEKMPKLFNGNIRSTLDYVIPNWRAH